MDNTAVATAIDKALPEGLRTLQRLTGLPAVFGGATFALKRRRQLRITRLVGTLGDSLNGVEVPAGRGLGGSVLRQRATCRVNDYATADKITHEYDDLVVRDEQITSIFAVPVVLDGTVCAVLYGGVRDRLPIGDRTLRVAEVIAAKVQRDLRTVGESTTGSALDELAEVIRDTPAGPLRERLLRIHRGLAGNGGERWTAGVAPCPLAPREIDVLRLVDVGASNVEIAAELLLSGETVKAYLRSATQKLGVHNRTAAVHAARMAGVL